MGAHAGLYLLLELQAHVIFEWPSIINIFSGPKHVKFFPQIVTKFL